MQPPPSDDPRLDHLLDQWQPGLAPSPEFHRHVWARVRATNTSLARILRFPLTLPLAACLALALGAATAFQLQQRRTNERMALAYAQSIDPFHQSPGEFHHHDHTRQ